MPNRICKLPDCGTEYPHAGGYGMCPKHYAKWKKYGDPYASAPPRSPRVVGVEPCTIAGCGDVQVARGWCSAHYTRWRRYGDPLHRFGWEVVGGCRVCPRCRVDKPLSDFASNDSYCKHCAAAMMREVRAINPPPRRGKLVDLTCDCCGVEFVGDGRRSRYCSVECFEAFKHRANWKHLNTRRARLRDALVEPFDRLEIFERDGWVCQLCGMPVDRAARFPAPMSASLDHIIPISRGGTHEPGNAQCSHLHCNIVKAARVA